MYCGRKNKFLIPKRLPRLRQAVVIGHARFADPDNWREIAVGTTQNVRRGEGDKSDFLLADLLLTDRKAIEAVESGDLKEVSCGYDADTQETPQGIEQIGIVGNHVALVVSARCSGCKIGDGSMTTSLKTRLQEIVPRRKRGCI